MKNKKQKITIAISLFVIMSFVIFSIPLFNSQSVSYCCEKLENGAWCQNAPEQECNSDYRKAATSCDSTGYCKMGTCYDSDEGTCLENVPQEVCTQDGGVWREGSKDNLPQCQLGCCLMGDQAAFVTQTRCKSLSGLYGLEIDYRTDITNEATCIMSATSDVKGACVYKEEGVKTCDFTTQEECKNRGLGNGTDFYANKLCSAEELETECGKSQKTTCVEGRDEVYYVDTCGNLANIYDASRYEDDTYWSEVVPKSEACGAGASNAASASCGNCDYYSGSTCQQYERGETGQPSIGNYVCKDLSCEWQGEKYEHGETWCANSGGDESIKPGSSHFRLVCYDNEVSVEPCASYRNELCIEDELNGFSTAACRVNKWQDCTEQDSKKYCENEDQRDCQWVEDLKLSGNQSGDEQGACIPKYPPGFKLSSGSGNNSDSQQGSAEGSNRCSLASLQCTVTKTEDILGGNEGWESDLGCVDSNGKILDSWKNQMNEVCTGLGDCGADVNYKGFQGFENDSEVINKIEKDD